MIRLSISFLLGALVPTIGIYLTGGANRSILITGLILGVLIVLVPLLCFARKSASVLWSLHHAHQDFHAHYRVSEREMKEMTGEAVKGKGAASVSDSVAGDVISALINLGVPKNKAVAVVKEVQGNCTGLGRDELFKASIGVVRTGRA